MDSSWISIEVILKDFVSLFQKTGCDLLLFANRLDAALSTHHSGTPFEWIASALDRLAENICANRNSLWYGCEDECLGPSFNAPSTPSERAMETARFRLMTLLQWFDEGLIENSFTFDASGITEKAFIPILDAWRLWAPLTFYVRSVYLSARLKQQRHKIQTHEPSPTDDNSCCSDLTRPSTSNRVLVGLVGPAGSGKTTWTAIMRRLWNASKETLMVDIGPCATIQMDGYHHFNAYLKDNGLEAFKGRPNTFDFAAFETDLNRVRSNPDVDVFMRIYDRNIHDPVLDGLCVPANHALVLVEGLFLAHHFASALVPVFPMDATIGLAIPRHVSCARVVARKLLGGKTREEATAHYERADFCTFKELTLSVMPHLDLVISRHYDDPGRDEQHTEPSKDRRWHMWPVQICISRPQVHTKRDIDVENCSRLSSPAYTAPVGDQPRVVDLLRIQSATDGLILAVGVSPCVQRTLQFSGPISSGAVHRAQRTTVSIGGKAHQMAFAANNLKPDSVIVAHWLEGDQGHLLSRLMDSCGIAQKSTWIHPRRPDELVPEGGTRTCTTLIVHHDSMSAPSITELVEPSPPVDVADVENFLAMISSSFEFDGNVSFDPRTSGDDVNARKVPVPIVAFCGSVPSGAPNFYDKVIKTALKVGDISRTLTPRKPFVLVDAVNDLPIESVMDGSVTMLKVNHEELIRICNLLSEKTRSENSCSRQGSTEKQLSYSIATPIRTLALFMFGTTRLEWIGVTDGPHMSYLFQKTDDLEWQFRFPPVEKYGTLVNPIGAGDTVSGGFLVAYRSTVDCVLSFQIGLAYGTAKCLRTLSTSVILTPDERECEMNLIQRIFSDIDCRKFTNIFNLEALVNA